MGVFTTGRFDPIELISPTFPDIPLIAAHMVHTHGAEMAKGPNEVDSQSTGESSSQEEDLAIVKRKLEGTRAHA